MRKSSKNYFYLTSNILRQNVNNTTFQHNHSTYTDPNSNISLVPTYLYLSTLCTYDYLFIFVATDPYYSTELPRMPCFPCYANIHIYTYIERNELN